ncbi:unnamed protein product [Caenorhabditis angaria]|uniref:Serine/threonine-protein kinase kin-29 n=1 Tax=Caenorhabditis angaria TaxID=860376 RepID=A0A9P1J0V7_9PELO|nr:unnamed protein product [Caenorhabditis angaria]
MATPRRRIGLEKIGLYDVGRVIGRGNFATVRIGRHRIAKTKVAIKSIDVSKLDKENLVKIEREVQILKTIDHPHIVKTYEIMRHDRMIYIVTEYCSGGELYDTLIEKGRVPENQARKWFAQTASALQYLHSRGIVHRDLKAENILLGKDSEIKLIDFGFSNFQEPDNLLNTWCGSPPYAAPELLLGKSYDGMKADIWSMGVLLYILVTGGFPFPSDSVNKLKRSVLSGQVKIPYWVSVECADFIRKMLVLNPAKRYNIQNVLQHRWMSGQDETPSFLSSQLLEAIPSSSFEIRQQTTSKLNPTIMLFMQQHGRWGEDQICDAVRRRDFESPIFSTYELLHDKVKKTSDGSSGDDYPRRGSRGSILSGRANVDDQPLTPTISAHQLAQLNLSSPESDSDDSSNSDLCDDSPMSSSLRPQNHDRQFGFAAQGLDVTSAQNRHENRRHTLCASEQILTPNLIPFTSPLLNGIHLNAPLGITPMPEGQAADFSTPLLHPAFGVADYTRMLPVPKNERRASAGETLLPTNFDIQQHFANLPNNTLTFPETVEEEGKTYLNKYGGKRNTVHCLNNQMGGGIQNPIPRYNRAPYSKAPPTERRSSWASAAPSQQQQNHLEKLFKQTLQVHNDIQNLHKEFNELSYNCSQSTNEGSSLACPQISITDEYNRQHNIAPSASSFDPVSMFQKNAQELVFGQRPATAIGFSSTTSFSGTSTPDQTARSMDDRVKSFVSSLPFADIIEELKNSLNSLKIPFSETNELVYEDHEMRRLSLPTGVEIGVAVLPPEQKSHVEFAILSNDSPTSEIICDQLICRLRMIDPNSTAE